MTNGPSFRVGIFSLLVASRVLADTITVTSIEDSGLGTLRQAILDINNASGPHELLFGIPGDGVRTISPLTPFPDITQTVTVDGYSQPGSRPNTLADGNNAVLLIRLDGVKLTNLNSFAAGLRFKAPNNRVRGLIILRFGTGIELQASSSSVIAGNWIGLDADGTGRGNTSFGIKVTCPVYSQSISNVIGGITPSDRNIISANGTGIFFFPGTASHNTVLGNFIGTDATGTRGRGNTFGCVVVQSATNIVIGGAQPGARNILSASTGAGGAGTEIIGGSAVRIQGNYIGTDVGGSGNLGNSDDGIYANGADGLIIGGSAPGEGNHIGWNRKSGIFLLGSTHTVAQGNYIGTDASGLAQMGNADTGIYLMGGGTNLIGGSAIGAANLIRFNNGPGVQILAGEGNTISGNLIAFNGMAIELGFDGKTPNDAGDGDTGANRLQNYPLLTLVDSAYGLVMVQGNLNSSPLTSYRLEFFAIPPWSPDGRFKTTMYLGTANVNADANGDVAFALSFPGSIPEGYQAIATATDPAGNTSEFSPELTPNVGSSSVSLILPNGDQPQSIRWPANASGFRLESTEALTPPVIWQTVTVGITTEGNWNSYPLPVGSSEPARFFRLTR